MIEKKTGEKIIHSSAHDKALRKFAMQFINTNCKVRKCNSCEEDCTVLIETIAKKVLARVR